MYKQAKRNSDLDIAAIFAGEGLDLIHDILPAKMIVQSLVEQFDYSMGNIRKW
ncbi:hypothetical protein Psal006b_01469 [Piscirickettsia salmonis]|uniref:Nitronate monooxygenase n=2 Tax=Piscirickettsia salmonis TaxID=1238 RepID=A0AAC8VIB2_PISSA|nr:hypothetical protein [Piscirickettsia salmonis]ALB22918.1 nitronate monooxygenase [Piscirickettsia salmonis]QGN98479.1 hypothetical protein Psal006b_01469 [Piscirickettsia salmonis]QGO02099.1 hypothetical protein Psal008_01483 [Piscirickettsia salmonis]QGO12787.1 hypothetical protein Psal010b_01467 [Piscirickettsia salmonis]QGO19829.1 hypothetical protein Psal013_01479 [Piscirickettsia salmonis]